MYHGINLDGFPGKYTLVSMNLDECNILKISFSMEKELKVEIRLVMCCIITRGNN